VVGSAASGAGGLLNLLVADTGRYQLAEIHRFGHQWEAEASTRLRVGDQSVVDVYHVGGRLRGGTGEEMCAGATRPEQPPRWSGGHGQELTACHRPGPGG
jgi:hypothetical protein